MLSVAQPENIEGDWTLRIRPYARSMTYITDIGKDGNSRSNNVLDWSCELMKGISRLTKRNIDICERIGSMQRCTNKLSREHFCKNVICRVCERIERRCSFHMEVIPQDNPENPNNAKPRPDYGAVMVCRFIFERTDVFRNFSSATSFTNWRNRMPKERLPWNSLKEERTNFG